ncbi:hypothetical protein IGI50_001950 [Enterococcus sp. DIV0170]
MGRTGIVEYKAFLKVAKMFVFTLYSAKTQRLDRRLILSCDLMILERFFAEFLCGKPFFYLTYSFLFLIT